MITKLSSLYSHLSNSSYFATYFMRSLPRHSNWNSQAILSSSCCCSTQSAHRELPLHYNNIERARTMVILLLDLEPRNGTSWEMPIEIRRAYKWCIFLAMVCHYFSFQVRASSSSTASEPFLPWRHLRMVRSGWWLLRGWWWEEKS